MKLVSFLLTIVVTSALAPASSRRAFLVKTANVAATMAATSLSPASAASSPIIYGSDDIMKPKQHGTSDKPVQSNLLYGVDVQLADRISNYNRVFAERAGYWENTKLEEALKRSQGPITFYDSVTGLPLFKAPQGRSMEDFLAESRVHGWPSFRDQEVVWDNVRVLKSSGETVSLSGTHLGHNLPDRLGNRYCINLVSIAGQPASSG